MTGISFYCFLWRLISVRRVRASNGRQNRFFYRSHRNGQSRKNIVFMRLCGVSGIHFLRHGEQIILLFFIERKPENLRIFWLSLFTGKVVEINGILPLSACGRRAAEKMHLTGTARLVKKQFRNDRSRFGTANYKNNISAVYGAAHAEPF